MSTVAASQKQLRLATSEARDAAAFCALSNSLYSRPVDAAYYDWQFFQPPFETKLAALVEGDAWVACYGMQLRPLAGTARCVAWAIDIMVAASRQRQGLFATLAAFAAGSVMNASPAALCVMANHKADAAHVKKLGWKRTETFVTYVADAAPHRASFDRMDFFALDDFRECEPLITARAHTLHATRRSAADLNWRFKRNPRYRYETFGVARKGELFGYLVLKVFRDPVTGESVGDIVDIMWSVDDSAACEAMLRFALSHFFDQGIRRAATWLQTNTMLDDAGLRVGFKPTTQQRFFCVAAIDSQRRDIDRSDRWFLTMADSEVY